MSQMFANAVINEETGQSLEYWHLIQDSKYQKTWATSCERQCPKIKSQLMPDLCVTCTHKRQRNTEHKSRWEETSSNIKERYTPPPQIWAWPSSCSIVASFLYT
eukprot:2626811-Ditylum_brightwellii.AAC.1